MSQNGVNTFSKKLNHFLPKSSKFCLFRTIFVQISPACGPNREVNNRLIGWAIAHLVNYFAHPVNKTYPLPKITHPVNYLAHRKIGTVIILQTDIQDLILTKLTNPQLETTLEHPPEQVIPQCCTENGQYLSWVNINSVRANDSTAFKERHFSKFPEKTHYLGLSAQN